VTPSGWRRLTWLCALLTAGCAGLDRGGRETVTFLLVGPDWVAGNRQEQQGRMTLTEFVRKGQTATRWTELYTVLNFSRRGMEFPPEAGAMVEGLRRSRLDRCPRAAWTVLRSGPDDVLYEVKTRGCAELPDQHELGRVLYGKWNIFHLIYQARGRELAADRRAAWLDALSQARIKREPETRTGAER
jgi:hypothetical protein